MRIDFTPRRFFDPQTPEDAAKLNQEIQKLANLYEKVDKLSRNAAMNLAESQAKAGNLNNEIERLEKSLDDLIFASDFLYRSFQETTAELRNQNVLLKLGRSAFSDLTNQAQKLTNFQQGYSDLQEKDFKKIQSSLKIQKSEIGKIVEDLEKNADQREQEIRYLNSIQSRGEKLTKTEKERLNTLVKEQALFSAAKDAQESGLKLLEREYDISKQIYKVKQDLGGLAAATANVISKYGADLSQYLDISDAAEAVNEFNKKVIDDALKQKNVVEQLQQIEKNKLSIQKEALDAAKVVRDIEKEIKTLTENQVDLARLQVEEQRKKNELDALQAQITERKNALEQANADQTRAGLARRSIIQNEINDLIRKEGQLTLEKKSIADQISDTENKSKKVNELKNQLSEKRNNLATKESEINSKLAAEEQKAYDVKQAAIKATSTGLTGFINKFKSLNVLISNLNFTKVFTDPVVLLTTLVKLGFEANAQVVELGKSFGVSAEAAENIRQEVASFARGTGDTFINTNRLLKAQSELSKELGIAVKFSNEELATFAKLTELTGLSAQEAGKLALASKAAGMPTEAYTDQLREAAFNAMQATKTHFSSKEVLQDISKLSAGILVKFQGNPKALATAVVEAKKLGLTLDQIDKIGESLLNFEQSIENELKAELMTGKQLNLERARAAALSGDQLALTREISSQVGTLKDFQNMNVLAQKSLADAFGLSREEMAEMLMKQEAINQYGDEAAKLNKEQLEDMKAQGLSASEYLKKQEQQRTAQIKFQDAMTKLQDIIGNLVAGPMGQLLDALANIVGVAMKALVIFKPLFDLIAFAAEKLSDFANTNFGKVILGIGMFALFLPKIASGFSGILTLTGTLGKSLKGVFSLDGIKKYFDNIKQGFLGTKLTQERTLSSGIKVIKKPGASVAEDLADKAKETITDKAKDKTGELAEKVTGSADKVTEKTKGDGIGGFLKGIKMNDVLKGAAAILILSGALFVAAKAFQEFASVEWESIAKGGVALLGLVGITKLLGNSIPGIIKGAIAMGILGAALIPLGYALKLAAPGIEAFGKAIKSAFEGIGTIITAAAGGIATIFSSLQNVDVTKLLAIGPALVGIGVGLASLGAGSVINAIGSFLGGDPIKKIEKLAATGDKIKVAADAFQSLATALTQTSVALQGIDVSKLEALNEFAENRESESIVKSVTELITTPIKAVGEAIGIGGNTGKGENINTSIDLTPMINAIKEVKASVDRLYSKETAINMDGKKIGTTLVQGSYKSS